MPRGSRSSASFGTRRVGRTARSVEVGGPALVVSQFTLYADTSRGRRPGFTDAGPPDLAERLYRRFAEALRTAGIAEVELGRFGAEMRVELVNDGPFTIWLDTESSDRGTAGASPRSSEGDGRISREGAGSR